MINKINDFNAGIIGLGQIGFNIKYDKTRGRIWAHSEAYHAHKKVNLIAAADICDNARNKFKKEYPSVDVYSNYEDMIKESEINIISLCTHESICAEILENIIKKYPKIKYIFCEKPVSSDSKKIDTLIKLAEKNDVRVLVNYFRRWQEPFKILKKIIDENHYGSIQSLTGYGCTALKTSSSHLLDVLISLSPNINSICAFKQNSYERIVNNSPDPGYSVIMNCENDCVVFLKSTSKDPKNFMFEIDIIFDEARVIWIDGSKKISVYKFTDKNNYAGDGYSTLNDKPKNISFHETETMIDSISELIHIDTKKDITTSNLRNASNTVKVIEAIEKSSKQSSIVYLSRGDLYEE